MAYHTLMTLTPEKLGVFLRQEPDEEEEEDDDRKKRDEDDDNEEDDDGYSERSSA